MKKFLPLLLIISMVFGIDCKDLMKFKDICIFKKNNIQSLKSHCHAKKENHSKSGGCDCPDKKSVSIQDSAKNGKDFIKVQFIYYSPLNVLFTFKSLLSTKISDTSNIYLLDPTNFPTKTIHLLI